jgi:hypothetical protein
VDRAEVVAKLETIREIGTAVFANDAGNDMIIVPAKEIKLIGLSNRKLNCFC